MTRKGPKKYVTEFEDRHGKTRYRFRKRGHADHYFTATPGSDEFNRQYHACLANEAAPKVEIGQARSKPGTFSALIATYYGTPEFTGLRDSTKATYRGILERFREKHGDKCVATIERRHIRAIIGSMSATPAAANNLLDRLKSLLRLAIDLDWRKDDPTARLRGFKPSGDGFHTWTEDEIAQFERRHPIGTQARLALALMLYTGSRRSDAVKLGWQHIEGDRINVSQQKTSARVSIRMHDALKAVLAHTPRENLTFLVTAYGKPRTAAGMGNWFREQCDAAGLPQCSSHGLRKAIARRLAEAGCGNQLIKSITGHKTDKEVSRYTAAADQVTMSDLAMDAMEGAEREHELSNRGERLDKTGRKPLKVQEK